MIHITSIHLAPFVLSFPQNKSTSSGSRLHLIIYLLESEGHSIMRLSLFYPFNKLMIYYFFICIL